MDERMNQTGYQGAGMRDTLEMSGEGTVREEGDLIRASRVKGTAVYDSDGEKIGTVDDVMLTKRSGEVAYAVMSFGGFLGIGEKYHPLPWNTLAYDTALGGYRVSGTGESYRNAPSFSQEAFEKDDWDSSTDSYYGDASRDTGRFGTRSDADSAATYGNRGASSHSVDSMVDPHRRRDDQGAGPNDRSDLS